MNKILYKPTMGLSKKYDTDGYVEPINDYVSHTTEDSETEDSLKETANEIIALQNTMTFLPNDLKPIVHTMLNTLEFIFIQIDPEYLIPHTSQDKEFSKEDADLSVSFPESNNDQAEQEMANSLLFSDVVPNIRIKTLPKDKIQLINKMYCVTLLEITKDYINELKKSTTQYFMDMGMLIAEHNKAGVDFLEKKYTYKTTDLKNKDLYHISDFIIKSQIVRNQKQRLIDKIINEEESLNRIKACEVARELGIRYAKEKYRNNTVYHDLFSNLSLKESRITYEQKLENNLYELYKYLNSSVILLDECLRLYMREAQAKSILIKEEGIKL